MHHPGDLARPVGRAEGPRPAEERLTAALAALAARDRLLADRAARLAACEDAAARLAAAEARLADLADDLAAVRRARQAELEERDRRIARLEAALLEAYRAAEVQGQPGDDLKRIRGIGPVIESLLHGLGINTFRQLAALSPDDLRRVGDLLGVFRGRIERDRWIPQAVDLAASASSRRPG